MPGITGMIAKGPRARYENDLKIMVECMKHEPFYNSGHYVNETLGVYAGWVCHPNSFADCMPLMNREKNLVLLFAGEHFSDAVEGASPTAAEVLEQYEREGEGVLRQLNGWFCGLLIDLKVGKVLLFNDRYGMQRLHYYEDGDRFLFGSEAKSLLKVAPKLRQLDLRGVGELISCNCVLAHRTIFSRVSLLPGGAAWSWDKAGHHAKKTYFSPSEWEGLDPLDENTFLARLAETVKVVIPRYFREKGRIGMSLTGGLDSRMIMACLNLAPGELPCYTFGGKKDMLDITIARQVAEACDQTYSVLRLDPSFFADFPSLAQKTVYLTDGNVDVSSAHDMFFNKAARSIAPIRITGKFGSEVVRDHTMFNADLYQGNLFVPEMRAEINRGVDTLVEVKKGHQLSVALFKDFPWREFNKIVIEQSQSVFRSPYMDNDLAALMYRAPAGVRSSNQPQRDIIRNGNPKLRAIISDRGYGDQTNPLVAKAIELYYYVIFKTDYTYLYAMPHWLTRLDTWLMAITGGKQFFGLQKFEYYRIWYRQELSKYVKDILLDPRTLNRPYFDRKTLVRMVETHTRGSHNYANEITKAISLELIQRNFIEA